MYVPIKQKNSLRFLCRVCLRQISLYCELYLIIQQLHLSTRNNILFRKATFHTQQMLKQEKQFNVNKCAKEICAGFINILYKTRKILHCPLPLSHLVE